MNLKALDIFRLNVLTFLGSKKDIQCVVAFTTRIRSSSYMHNDGDKSDDDLYDDALARA